MKAVIVFPLAYWLSVYAMRCKRVLHSDFLQLHACTWELTIVMSFGCSVYPALQNFIRIYNCVHHKCPNAEPETA